MITLEHTLELLSARKLSDGQYSARCPAHNDSNPSLSIREGDDGKVLFYCHAGCSFEKVRDAVRKRVLTEGLTVSEYEVMKGFPPGYLQAEWRAENIHWQNRPAVALPYIESLKNPTIRRKVRRSKDSH